MFNAASVSSPGGGCGRFGGSSSNVIASEAKQSRNSRNQNWIGSSLTLLAMTANLGPATDGVESKKIIHERD